MWVAGTTKENASRKRGWYYLHAKDSSCTGKITKMINMTIWNAKASTVQGNDHRLKRQTIELKKATLLREMRSEKASTK